MKNIFQNSILPFALFTGALVLFGCDQIPSSSSDSTTTPDAHVESSAELNENKTVLKSGNMFYIVRDVADVQLQSGEYIDKIKQTQSELQSALDSKNTQQLQMAADHLKTELTEFNQSLKNLSLKSQEIDDIRQQMMQSNQQILNSSFMKGDIDLSKVDLQKIEQQMGNVQSEMIKLAAMLLDQNSTDTAHSDS